MSTRTAGTIWLTDSFNYISHHGRVQGNLFPNQQVHYLFELSHPMRTLTSFCYSVLTSRFILTLGAQMEMWNVYMWWYSVRYGKRLWHILNGHYRIRLWYKMDVMIVKRSLNNRMMGIFPKIRGKPIDASQISSTSTHLFNLFRCSGVCRSI